MRYFLIFLCWMVLTFWSWWIFPALVQNRRNFFFFSRVPTNRKQRYLSKQDICWMSICPIHLKYLNAFKWFSFYNLDISLVYANKFKSFTIYFLIFDWGYSVSLAQLYRKTSRHNSYCIWQVVRNVVMLIFQTQTFVKNIME